MHDAVSAVRLVYMPDVCVYVSSRRLAGGVGLHVLEQLAEDCALLSSCGITGYGLLVRRWLLSRVRRCQMPLIDLQYPTS